MIVRVRFDLGQPVQRRSGKNRHVALAAGVLLAPIALMPYALGIWRLGSDMGLAAEFPISGIFSHWQLWIAIGAALQLASYALNRYARLGRMTMPPVTIFPVRPPRTVAGTAGSSKTRARAR